MIIRYINFLKLLKRLFFDKDMHANYKNFTPPPKKKYSSCKKILCRFADNYFFFLFPNASYSFALTNFIRASTSSYIFVPSASGNQPLEMLAALAFLEVSFFSKVCLPNRIYILFQNCNQDTLSVCSANHNALGLFFHFPVAAFVGADAFVYLRGFVACG